MLYATVSLDALTLSKFWCEGVIKKKKLAFNMSGAGWLSVGFAFLFQFVWRSRFGCFVDVKNVIYLICGGGECHLDAAKKVAVSPAGRPMCRLLCPVARNTECLETFFFFFSAGKLL